MFLDKFFKKKLHIFFRHVHIYEPATKARPDWFSNHMQVGSLSPSKQQTPVGRQTGTLVFGTGFKAEETPAKNLGDWKDRERSERTL